MGEYMDNPRPAPGFVKRLGGVVDNRRGVTFQALKSENLLNRLTGESMPFGFTVNPFRGCELGCRYCYARPTHEYLGHGDPEEFEERIYVKEAGNTRLLSSLIRARDTGQEIAIGTATDPYQPAEARFAVTRGVLEVMARGEYFWVPLEMVDSIAANPPRFPRDLIYLPARLTSRDGSEAEVYLPALYPNSHEHPDEQVQLGRSTDWKQADGGPVLGAGARTYLVGDEGVRSRTGGGPDVFLPWTAFDAMRHDARMAALTRQGQLRFFVPLDAFGADRDAVLATLSQRVS